MHGHHSTTPEHIQAALGNAQEGEEKKHRGRARSYTTQSHSPELILLVTKKVSQFGRNLQLADKRWTSHAWSWDEIQVQEKSAHEDNTHKAPCSTRPFFPASISWEKVSHFSYNHFFTSYFSSCHSSICNGIETRVRTCEKVQQLPESHYKEQVDSAVQFTV